MRRTSALIGSLLLAAGCGGGSGTDAGTDVGPTDSGTRDTGISDTGISDTGSRDTGVVDAAERDTGTPDVGSDAGGSADFSVTSFGSTGCTTIDEDDAIGDDRSGIAVSSERVLLSADFATGAWDLDLTRGGPISNGSLSVLTGDGLIADVLTGQLYILAGDTGPLGRAGGPTGVPGRLSHLILGLDDASEGASDVTLSTPISFVPTQREGTMGIFAGAGEIGIHDGTNLFVIDVATGNVTDLGAVVLPTHTLCETWAYRGVLERVAGVYSLVIVRDDRTIVRVAVATGAVTPVLSLPTGGPPSPGLSDMCSLAVSVSNNRWYFHHEFNSDLAPDATDETLGFCDATYVTTGGDFAIGGLGTTTCNAIDVFSVVNDDRGSIAVAAPNVFLLGDGALGRWDLDLGSPISSALPIRDGLVTEFHTATIWSLASETALIAADENGALIGNPSITRLVQLDASGAETSTVITLSTPIGLDGSEVGLFSGWDELVIHDGTHVFQIALPSGTVTDLGAMEVPEHTRCENWAYWGIAERIGGQTYLVAVNDVVPSIDRFRVPDGERATISSPITTEFVDMCSISLSTTLNRWYFHHEGESNLTSGPWSETLGFCDATIVHP